MKPITLEEIHSHISNDEIGGIIINYSPQNRKIAQNYRDTYPAKKDEEKIEIDRVDKDTLAIGRISFLLGIEAHRN